MATSDDAHLPTYDNTKLVALNTCPTWGIVTYQMHKTMGDGSGRVMPLECGAAMHEVFAFVRLMTLHRQLLADTDSMRGGMLADNAYLHHGTRLFGHNRLDTITSLCSGSDHVERTKSGSIAVLDTSGYYDDPRDKRRTLSNMEEAAYAYIDRWRWDQPVWMRDPNNPQGDVGIEIPFDLVCTFESDGKQVRLTGKIDGIHVHAGDNITLHENKTASRLNDAWSSSFALASQITHYCVAASVFTMRSVRKADVLGLCIPLPKTYDYGGFVRESVTRQDHHFARWIQWLRHTIGLAEEYADNPYDAPKYTHSCNRYFRSCSLIPFCDADDTEQRDIINEMHHREWSPLDKVTIDD